MTGKGPAKGPSYRLGTSMPLLPLAGLLLRDGARLPETPIPGLPMLDAPRLDAPTSRVREAAEDSAPAGDAWAEWWPTTLGAPSSDMKILPRLAAASPFWTAYLAQVQTTALAVTGRLHDAWTQNWRKQMRESGRVPEQVAAKSALAGCRHGRFHRHEASVVVLPFAERCWQTYGNIVVIDTETRSTMEYADKLAAHLRGLWDETRQ